MHSILSLGISALRTCFEKKQLSVQDVIHAYYAHTDKHRNLNVYITETREDAFAAAEESQKRWLSGSARSLEGIPIAVKDVFCTAGVRTTNGSRMLENFIPPYSSTVVEKLQNAGAIILGKANQDEFCMGSTSTSPFSGPVHNPWNTACSTGGSSGGSAAAVAAGMALGAIGTDTGGSIRQPASFCGVVGMKPTYGRCSRYGIVAFSSSLDQAGPLARSVEDAALLLEHMAGHDPRDATSSTNKVPVFSTAVGASVKGMRIGVPDDWKKFSMSEETLNTWEKGMRVLEEAGCIIHKISLPHAGLALPSYYIIACAEAASNLQRFDGVKYGFSAAKNSLEDLYTVTRAEGFGAEVKRRIMIGTHILSHGYHDGYYAKAQKAQAMIREDFRQAFSHVDLVLCPSTPTPAFPLNNIPDNPVEVYLNDLFTVPANMSGICAISVPAGVSEANLPMGLQLMGAPFEEMKLLQGAYALEKAFSMPPLPF